MKSKILVALVACFVLGGCSSESSSTTDADKDATSETQSTTTDVAPAQPEPAPAPEPVAPSNDTTSNNMGGSSAPEQQHDVNTSVNTDNNQPTSTPSMDSSAQPSNPSMDANTNAAPADQSSTDQQQPQSED